MLYSADMIVEQTHTMPMQLRPTTEIHVASMALPVKELQTSAIWHIHNLTAL